jgi:hypothetical protein
VFTVPELAQNYDGIAMADTWVWQPRNLITPNANNEINISINGERVELDVQPIIIDNRTLVPMIEVFEAFGAELEYITGEHDLLLIHVPTSDGIAMIRLWLGDTAVPFENRGTMDVQAQVIDGHIMIPLSFFELLEGFSVGWDEGSHTVKITN